MRGLRTGQGIPFFFYPCVNRRTSLFSISNFRIFMNSQVSYIGLINRFWRLDATHNFTPQATRLYFFLLNIANISLWKGDITQSDVVLCANCSLTRKALREAREVLSNAGLISFALGGNGRGARTVYSFTGCANCSHAPAKECQTECQIPAHKTQKPQQAPVVPPANTSPQQQPSVAVSEQEPIPTPPNDGKPRNFDALCRHLRKLKATRKEALQLITISNFGQIGHPIWSLLHEISNSSSIKFPVKFLLTRLV